MKFVGGPIRFFYLFFFSLAPLEFWFLEILHHFAPTQCVINIRIL